MPAHFLVVIGTSAGGTRLLVELVSQLPADFPAAICIVTHIPAYTPSHLPEILSRAGALRAVHPADGDPIEAGHIYCAPSDSHLLIENGHLQVTKGPKENRVRPAIDPLFRSAAYSEGPAVIGVVLSGMLDDGTSGLWTIERFGGTTIIQDPREAEFDSMPQSALDQVRIDHVTSIQDLAALLQHLVSQPLQDQTPVPVTEAERERIGIEVSIARRDNAFRKGVMDFGKVTPQTCPECGGVLVQIKEGGFTRYRCHTGHAYTGDTLLVSVTENIEETLWKTMRVLEEASMLLESTGRELEDAGQSRLAAAYERKAREVEQRTRLIFEQVQDSQEFSQERIARDTAPE